MSGIAQLTREEAQILYSEVLKAGDPEALRRLCREDLYFLLRVGCRRNDMDHDWIYARCREVEANPDGRIDLWFREGYKSTIITFGLSIQDILKNPEVTIGIFSHTRPIAKAFLAQIKRELETNTFLQGLFDDVLYKEPCKESPLWSLDSGIVVKRKGNPKEATVEAWGLVDGQPTSKHYAVLNFDDVVTLESVTTPEQIAKTTNAWAVSLNLGVEGGRVRYIGTKYHLNDTYKEIIKRGAAIPRIHAATDDGTFAGKSVLFTQESFDKKCSDYGSYVASCQLLMNLLADNAMGFHPDWWMHYNELRNHERWNFYILVDPASKKKNTNDYTVMAVVGLGNDGNYYLVDGIRDRLNLTERTKALFSLHRKWRPRDTGYEEYGLQADIEHIEYVQEQEGYRFHIQPLGGQTAKVDRIRRLVPLFEQRRFYMPNRLLFISREGKAVDFVKVLREDEYETFPVCAHDDGLDCLSRIVDKDLNAVFPKVTQSIPLGVPIREEKYDPFRSLGNNRALAAI